MCVFIHSHLHSFTLRFLFLQTHAASYIFFCKGEKWKIRQKTIPPSLRLKKSIQQPYAKVDFIPQSGTMSLATDAAAAFKGIYDVRKVQILLNFNELLSHTGIQHIMFLTKLNI
jgi:hypothetical protein